MYIQGRTQMIPNAETYENAVERILACGFEGVEINIYNREFQLKEEFFQPGFAERMRKFLEEKGVKYYSVGAHLDYTQTEENLQRVLEAIRITHEMGAGIMLITGAFRRPEENLAEQWSRQIACMKILGEEAARYQVKLAMEYEPGFVIHNSGLLLQAFAEADQPWIGVNADIGHFFLEEKEPLAGLESVGKYIWHAHLENMAAGVHNHLLPWEGDMDMKAYADKLHELGFDGQASLDIYQCDYEAIAEESIAYLKKYF